MSDSARADDGHAGSPTKQGVGARLERKEDDRLLRGRGQYVGDIRLPGMREVAFVRSPVAHAVVGRIDIPDDRRSDVFVGRDLADVEPILCVAGLPGFKAASQPVLAVDRVLHVGMAVAMCVGDTRAQAEDLAEALAVDYRELDVVHDVRKAREPGATLLHGSWGDNLLLTSDLVVGDVDAVARSAPVSVELELRTARQCMSPMEGRGVLAAWDSRMDQLVVHTSSQVPHLVRAGLARFLGLEEGRIRVIAPDVGGGFGYKSILAPEEVCIAWLAMKLRHPVRWLEDRREQLTAGANCREHHYRIRAHADRAGRLLAFDVEADVDSGAYSVYPFTGALEAGQLPSMLPGPYDFGSYRCRSRAVVTNKVPIVPYRGVARPGACIALELTIDAIARAVGREPYAVRLDNLVPPQAMPVDNITGKHFDGGDYPASVRRAVDAIDLAGVRVRQARGESDGRLIGAGFAFFNEQGSVGTSAYAKWGLPLCPGHEQAKVRLMPDGMLEVAVGIQSHGQGLETSLAQIAHEVLGVPVDRIRVVHGDTALTPYSIGTWGSRSMVMGGGAVARACRALAGRLARIGAHALGVPEGAVRVRGGEVATGDGRAVTIDEVARLWYLRPQELPPDVDPGGLEVTGGYRAARDSGTFSYATHAVVVAIDPETGQVEILDYAIDEDAGVCVNPMIVEGQIVGGTVQGIGTALYEEMAFSEEGQPLASTFLDYILPGATEVPPMRLAHVETPSPYTEFGVKGIGESGAIGSPAAILNAINDALKPLGAVIAECPATPRRVLAAIDEARNRAGRPV